MRAVILLLLSSATLHGQELKTTVVDTYPRPFLLALRVDANDRLFVGARETLYVYEPKKDGYHPRQSLYRFPDGMWIRDIEVRGDNLYVLTDTALYLFVDGVRKRADLLPRRLVWGIPYVFESMLCKALAWGPEGDLYLSFGGLDPERRLSYWTFFGDRSKLHYRGVGGILRCKPDGSDLRMVAQGVRRPGSLAFDRQWNLFTHDGSEKSYRYLHVTPHARLEEGTGPADGLPDLLTGNAEPHSGPFYFDEPALPKNLWQRLRWKHAEGSFDFAIKPSGASFILMDAVRTKDPPRDYSIAGGGRVFALYDLHKIWMLTNADSPEGHAYERYEASEATPERLWRELSTASWAQRQRAHLEIMRRGGDLLKEANKRLVTVKANDPAYPPLIWLAAKSGQGSVHLLAAVEHADPSIRLQAVRALTEFPDQLRGMPVLTKRLVDDDLHVRHAALLAHFEPKIGWDAAIQGEVERNAFSEDARLRQTATLLLAKKLTLKQIESLCGRVDPAKRLAGVLAAGFRLTLPPANEPIAPQLPLAHEKDYDTRYADEVRRLRELGRIGTFTIAEHWKADMHTVEQELLFKLLRKMLTDEERPARVQAASFLARLDDARTKDEVARALKK